MFTARNGLGGRILIRSLNSFFVRTVESRPGKVLGSSISKPMCV